MLTIVTPTYNRSHTLPILFESLKKQSVSSFKWLIVDDGSTDDTQQLVQAFIRENTLFPIRYIQKTNGGKHTALNVAIREVDTELFFIVDSDDRLTADAVQTIESDWQGIREKGLCGIGYLRGYGEQQIIGDAYPTDNSIDNFIRLRYNKGISGDKAEVWVTSALREYGGFPEFMGERFISESVLWIKVSRKYNMLFRNKIIYLCKYLEGGLSLTGRSLRFQCPEGMAYGSLETMTKEFSLKIRIKQALLYVVYSKFGGKKTSQIMHCPYLLLVSLCYVPGVLLYYYWRHKYMLHEQYCKSGEAEK